MRVLCVAEKPSIAKSITEILSGGRWENVRPISRARGPAELNVGNSAPRPINISATMTFRTTCRLRWAVGAEAIASSL